MAGRHLPADLSKGDANTIGGYAAVHDRPAAFEGSDGFSYSVELCTDTTGEAARPFGAYLFFLKWKRQGEQGIAGHLESPFVAWGDSAAAALAALGAWPLADVRAELERLIAQAAASEAGQRRWMDVRPADGAP
ncbi:MAG: hypothetical protein HY275_08635 [Gemmatimonadetes bacterium]|nr:hypothetical protein [Gemmatimonadota bacterium]